MARSTIPGPYVDTITSSDSARARWWQRVGARELLAVSETFGTPKEFANHLEVQKRFHLRGWQFGQWIRELGKKKLGMCIGVKGVPRSNATFWTRTLEININRWKVRGARGMFIARNDKQALTKAMIETGGAGAFAHEFGHFIDRLAGLLENSPGYGSPAGILQMNALGSRFEPYYIRIWEILFHRSKDSEFYKRLDAIDLKHGRRYWCSNVEIFARVFEKCIAMQLKRMKRPNYFLARPMKSYQSAVYPSDAVCKAVWPVMKKLVTEILNITK